MSDDPRRPVPGDPLDRGEPAEAERDAFGNPIVPGGHQPQPSPPAYGPGQGFAPPTAQPPGPPAPVPEDPPPVPPPVAAPPTPPGYHPAPPSHLPPGYVTPPQPVVPAAFGAHTLASWGQRVGAAAINYVLRLLAFIPAIAAFAASQEVVGVILAILAAVWITFLYGPVFMMRSGAHNGQTPGKQIVGIRVVREDGQPFGFGQAMLREVAIKWLLMEFVGGLFIVPPLVNYLWPLWDEQNRALHDMVASTRVVRA